MSNVLGLVPGDPGAADIGTECFKVFERNLGACSQPRGPYTGMVLLCADTVSEPDKWVYADSGLSRSQMELGLKFK